MSVTFQNIIEASETIANSIIKTPFYKAQGLSECADANVFIKCEFLQKTNSFKVRGACNRILNLSDAEKKIGVITMSAGNHAQALAYHAAINNIKAKIIMPKNTPFIKVQRTINFGAEVVLHGETLDDAKIFVEKEIENKGYIFVPPFDDDYIIAGQGTIGLEIMHDNPAIDTIIAPIGGGGLISGIAIAAKHFNPDIEIIGSEVDSFASMTAALNNTPYTYGSNTLADGIAVKKPAERTQKICQQLVKDIITVSEEQIEHAIYCLVEHEKCIIEGAGSAGVAALLKEKSRFKGKNVAVILCGGNIDARLLASVIYRNLERQGYIRKMRIIINDQPGTLGKISSCIGDMGANILDVAHHRMFNELNTKQTHLEIVVESRSRDHVDQIVKKIQEMGFLVTFA